ncbi:MAG TPA: hypothetical protein VF425_00190, partial [Thermoanaerobaculia bacterium]
ARPPRCTATRRRLPARRLNPLPPRRLNQRPNQRLLPLPRRGEQVAFGTFDVTAHDAARRRA